MKTKMGLMIILMGMIGLGFQNCTKVNFEGQDTNASSKVGTLGGDVAQDTQDSSDVDQDCGDDANDDNDCGDMACPEDDIADDKELVAYEDECKIKPNLPYVESAKDASLNHLRGAFAFHSESFMSVDDTRGYLALSSNSIALLNNTRGFLRIDGEGKDPSIKSMSNSRGKSILCGVSSPSLSNHRGGILIMGGNIAKLSDIRGNVIVVNGSIGDVDNFRGNIRLINSKITGSVTNFRGLVK